MNARPARTKSETHAADTHRDGPSSFAEIQVHQSRDDWETSVVVKPHAFSSHSSQGKIFTLACCLKSNQKVRSWKKPSRERP